jgi:cell division transport system permease protein
LLRKIERLASRRKNPSYFYAILSMTMVLFVLGVTAIVAYELRKWSNELKEQLLVEVVLNDEITYEQAMQLRDSIKQTGRVKKVQFISKEQAAKLLPDEMGDSYMTLLGYNPLYPSLDVSLLPQHADTDSFLLLKNYIASLPGVLAINSQEGIFDKLNLNINAFTMVGAVLAAILMMFAVSVIFTTLRLVIYSNRFVIRSMQLIGATRWFIIRPYFWRSLLNGFISVLMASLLLAGMLFFLDTRMPELGVQSDLITFALLFAALLIFGLLISLLSTMMAVFKYLRLKPEALY